MSACQSAAKQANDALAYARSVGAGSCGCACGGACESSAAGSCTCADEGGASGGCASSLPGVRKRAEKRKSRCKRQGPGCSNAACNAAADQAIAVIDAVADLPEGLPRVTMGQIRLARFAGGFKPPARRSAPPPPDMSPSSAGVPSRVTTDCSGCDTGGADEFCGSNPDAPNSKYAYSVGPWTPMLYGGCQREVGCVDYAGSCPDDSGATGMGNECDANYGLNVCNQTFNRWVFIPNVTEGVATGGSCGAVWTCVKGLAPDVETCGEAGPTPYPAARVSVVANVSEPRTQYCDGVQTSVDDSWRDIDWRAHGIDDETAPDVSASIWGDIWNALFADQRLAEELARSAFESCMTWCLALDTVTSGAPYGKYYFDPYKVFCESLYPTRRDLASGCKALLAGADGPASVCGQICGDRYL